MISPRSSGAGRAAKLACLLSMLASCAGASTRHEEVRAVTPVGSTPTPVAADAIELMLTTTDGSSLSVGRLRGSCALLFLFATFDGASQAALRPLRAFHRAHPEVQIVGITVEERPAVLADAWEHALSPPFPVTYDRSGSVLEGTSALGRIASVPRFRLLDAAGRSTAESVGYPRPGALRGLLSTAHCPGTR